MTDRWALADLRATAIMDAARTGAVAERNGRRLAEAAGLPPHPQAAAPASPGQGGPCSRRVEHSEPPGGPHGGRPRRGGAPAERPACSVGQEGDTAPPVAVVSSNDASTVPSKRGSTEEPGDGWLGLEFTVPCQPRGWQRDTPLGYGRSVKTAAEAAYQRDIAKFARQAKEACGATGLIRGGVRLAVVAHIAVPKSYAKAKRADCLAGRILPILKPDFDNIAKSVADALTGVLWADDKQVVAGSCLKVWAETGSLYVRVQAL